MSDMETALAHINKLVTLYEDEHPENCLDGRLDNEAIRYARAFYASYWDRKVLAEDCLTDDEKKAQANRCACRGSDDYCACQNEPDRLTVEVRAAAAKGAGE